MTIALILIGGAVFLNGIFLCMFSNINLGIILTVFVGAFFLAWGIFYRKISRLTKKGFLRALKSLALFLLSAEVIFICFIAVYGQKDNVNYDEDAVIVLGAGVRGDKVTLPLKMRLDTAVSYNKKNPGALIVVTGGQGAQETVTEARAMEKYLIECGVPKNMIIKEEKATSTSENMKFSKEILDKHFDKNYKVAIVTNNFHIYRGVSIAKNEGFKSVYHLHSGLQWYNVLPCYLRESLAVLKMWVFG